MLALAQSLTLIWYSNCCIEAVPVLRLLWFCAWNHRIVDTDMSSALRHFKDKLLWLTFNRMPCKFGLVSPSSFRKFIIKRNPSASSLLIPSWSCHSLTLSLPFLAYSPSTREKGPALHPVCGHIDFYDPLPHHHHHHLPSPIMDPWVERGPLWTWQSSFFFFFLQSPKWIG